MNYSQSYHPSNYPYVRSDGHRRPYEIYYSHRHGPVQPQYMHMVVIILSAVFLTLSSSLVKRHVTGPHGSTLYSPTLVFLTLTASGNSSLERHHGILYSPTLFLILSSSLAILHLTEPHWHGWLYIYSPILLLALSFSLEL